MRQGKIKFIIDKNAKPAFPVTRAEAVIVGSTTLDKVLADHSERIDNVETEVDGIGTITNAEIDNLFNN